MSHIALGAPLWPPPQFLALIRAKPIYDPRQASPARIVTGPELDQLLPRVFDEGKRAIRFDPDDPGADTWGAPARVWHPGLLSPGRWIKTGDCDEYVFEWASRLLDEGIDPGAIRYVMCRTEELQAHLVLTVDTEERTLVFCNRQQGIWTFGEGPMARYLWLKASEPGQFFWRAVE